MRPSPPSSGEGRCDLHLHTVFSDGILAPDTMVRKAKEVHLAAIGISDHDAVGGIEPAMRVSKLYGVEVVPGVELSCLAHKQDVHILGYYIDYKDPGLLAFLDQVCRRRKERAENIVSNLNKQGLDIDVNRVLEIAGGGALGRPHIAQALLERGLVRSADEAFSRYIGYNSPAYVPKMEISPLEAISFIHKYGGISVAAHPGSYRDGRLLEELIVSGLMGIEVYHPDNDPAAREYYLETAQKHGLFVTGGSDCHGGRRGRLFIGEVSMPYRFLAAMKKYKGIS